MKTECKDESLITAPSTSSALPPECRDCGCQQQLQKLRTELTEMREEIKALMTTQVAALKELRKEIRQGAKTKVTEPSFFENESLPFPNEQALFDFEREIVENDRKFSELQKDLCLRGPNEPTKFIKFCIRMFFTDEIAQNYNWLGVNKKKCAKKMPIMVAIKQAFHQRFPLTGEDYFNKLAMRHFQYAKDRVTKKNKYIRKGFPQTTESQNVLYPVIDIVENNASS